MRKTIKSIKVMLLPNNKQETRLFQCTGVSRWAYNWALGKQQENYKNGGKFIQDGDLRKELTKLKQIEEYKWLNSYSNNITKQAIKDACEAYKRFFRSQCDFPKFKSKKRSKPSFYQDNVIIRFSETHVKLEKLAYSQKKNKSKFNWVKLSERTKIPTECKYFNPRITFDGLNWFVSVGIEMENNLESPQSQGIGIDLGIKDLAICSDSNTYKNINKTKEVKSLEKKKRRLQRQISRKYENNKKGACYKKTSNIKKLEQKLLRLCHRLKNIRHNYLHQTTTEIINRKPMFIVLENLAVTNMMRNRHLAKAIQQQCFHEFYRQIQYKCNWSNIKFIEANRWYASSKTCSECGAINKKLQLSDREWVCQECGIVHDRDLNASINLMKYGQSIA